MFQFVIGATLVDSPIISVVMPIYNAEQHLRQAIGSVLGQSYTDFELLIIDDGSTDQSAQIARSFKDDRIKLITQPCNLGLVAALNRALAESRGKYIARMDGDDVCLPDRFALQLELMKNQELDVCGSDWVDIDVRGNKLKALRAPRYVDEVIATFATTVPYAHGSIMIRKSFFDKYALQYRSIFCEDYDLWIRCFELGARFGLVNSTLYFHRIHPGSITSRKRQEQADAAKEFRRAFVKNNLSLCQGALVSLSGRFHDLPNPLQVHTLYLAYRVFFCTGNVQLFSKLFFKTKLINKMRVIRRILYA